MTDGATATTSADEMLDPEALMAGARAEAELDDFGDLAFVDSLTRYVEALVTESRLNAMGRTAFAADLQRALVNRLRFQDDLNRHPEILDEVLAPPIVIVGIPRTGSTKLQRMLSCGPNVQKIDYWRTMNPAPFPGWRRGEPDPRIAAAETAIAALAQFAPDLMAAHPVAAEEAEEDGFLAAGTFDSFANTAMSRTKDYKEWVLGRSADPAWGYVHRLLRYFQWQDDGDRERPWILKHPPHTFMLDSIEKHYPQATVVHCHRDPVVTLASTCRLMEVGWTFASDDIDLEELGRDSLHTWSEALRQNLAQRESLDGRLEIVDIDYADIRDDALGVIERVLEARGQTLDDETRRAIEAWEQAHPQHQFGTHKYSLDRYGLTETQVAEAFGPYLDRFGPKAA